MEKWGEMLLSLCSGHPAWWSVSWAVRMYQLFQSSRGTPSLRSGGTWLRQAMLPPKQDGEWSKQTAKKGRQQNEAGGSRTQSRCTESKSNSSKK